VSFQEGKNCRPHSKTKPKYIPLKDHLNHNQQIQTVKAMVIKYLNYPNPNPNPNYYKRNKKKIKYIWSIM
jgi:hypothetical protein